MSLIVPGNGRMRDLKILELTRQRDQAMDLARQFQDALVENTITLAIAVGRLGGEMEVSHDEFREFAENRDMRSEKTETGVRLTVVEQHESEDA